MKVMWLFILNFLGIGNLNYNLSDCLLNKMNEEYSMVKVVFIGLGNMGGFMVINFVKVGYDVKVFDLVEVFV